ncbi:MAG TPA: adenylate/guanylate cyclase domain-containing protein, partial [Gammaproteobacteria bacterium]|nr:adenylate/guanylate cyclase domain-containing protein [Gammaproteobacteria bacterium]
MITRYLIRAGITLGLLCIFLLHIYGLRIGLLGQLENLAYDARVRLTMPKTVDPRIVIVDIDEASLVKEGWWPWPRERLALMVNNLFEQYHVKVVGFDIVFAEAQREEGLALVEHLANNQLAGNKELSALLPALRQQLNSDAAFAASMQNRPVVTGFVFKPAEKGEIIGVLPRPVLDKEAETAQLTFLQAGSYTGNLPIFQNAAAAGGFFNNPTVSPDGVYRRVPLLQAHDGAIYQSLALAMFRAAKGWPPVTFRFGSDDPANWNNLFLEYVEVGETRIPVDKDVAVYVPYRGYMHSFPYVSAADVIAGTARADVLRDAIVLVGTSAPGLFDLRVTPVGETYAGVEVHANLISGLLDERIKYHPQYTRGIHVSLLLLLAAVLTWVFTRSSMLVSLLVTLLTLVALVMSNLAAWSYANFIIPLASPLIFTVALFGLQMLYGFFIESRGKRQLSGLFGQYVPPPLVKEMARDPGAYSLEGENREMTVLFSDVRNFTTMSEGLSPTELTQLMNEYLTVMTRVIHEQRGTIDKYIGDAIMAFWGAPLMDTDHAEHAVESALLMNEAAAKLRQTFKQRGWPPLRVGIGLNTGSMNVGNMGSEFRMAYTVMGDAVNLGSRLEGLTKEYGVEILASESTREQAPGIQFVELDRVRVKGKEKPVAIFEPIGPRSAITAEQKQQLVRHKQAMLYYRQ